MYLIECDYGTRQVAWTWAEAQQWLAACGETATIRNRLTLRLLAKRVQVRVY